MYIRSAMKIILTDNSDSFTANLEHLLVACTHCRPHVVSYTDINDADFLSYDLAVISAGPGKPSEYPNYAKLLESGIPVLGICLGLQIINEHFGGGTARLPECIHGKTDEIQFQERHFVVARYHSLYLHPVAESLEVVAGNSIGLPMAVRHRTRAIMGYQFHPESFMTPDGGYFVDHAVSFLFGVRRGEVLCAGRGTRTVL
jgi:anthranilate/para-aminobenzoate synthase component II